MELKKIWDRDNDNTADSRPMLVHVLVLRCVHRLRTKKKTEKKREAAEAAAAAERPEFVLSKLRLCFKFKLLQQARAYF